jgi:hypothetical protein
MKISITLGYEFPSQDFDNSVCDGVLRSDHPLAPKLSAGFIEEHDQTSDHASDSIPVTSNYRLGFENGGAWFYTDAMPYRGSMMGVADENNPPQVIGEWHWGHFGFVHIEYPKPSLPDETLLDLPGIYFRRFSQAGSPPWATLRISLWLPMAILAIVPSLWVIHYRCFRRGGLEQAQS